MTKRGPHVCKVDANQAEIVAALRRAGASVQPIHTVGQGCPDLLVGWHGENLLIEVKATGNDLTDLTPDERAWWDAWRGDAMIVSSIDDALKLLGPWWVP